MTATDELAAFHTFDRLTTAQRAAVLATGTSVVVAAGSRLFEQDQAASGCWLIGSGQVALSTPVPGRGEVVLQTLGAGEVLGWSWLLPPYHWHYAATATAPVTAILLDTGRLRALADADPALGYPLALSLLEVVLGRLQHTRARLLDLYRSPRES